jgi:hypothetical protein
MLDNRPATALTAAALLPDGAVGSVRNFVTTSHSTRLPNAPRDIPGSGPASYRKRGGMLSWSIATLFGTLLAGAWATACAEEVALDFPTTNDIQTHLIAEFPTGRFTPSNGFPASFIIKQALPLATPPRHNFWDAPRRQPLDVSANVAGVREVYMLLDAYAPPPGATIAIVDFFGSDGAHISVPLVAGRDVRDFCQNIYANKIDDEATRNAFIIRHVRDSCSTNDVHTGYVTDYRIDEHQFVLPAEFSSQTLTHLTVTPTGLGLPVIVAITVITDIPQS